MRRNLVLSLAAGALAFVAVLCLVLWLLPSRSRDGAPRDPASGGGSSVIPMPPLETGIERAADYLLRVNGEDGRFEYRLFVGGRHGSKDKYNALRHAGAIYALADYRARTKNEERRARTQATIRRAVGYFFERYVRPLAAHPEMLAVWSDPKEEGGSRPTAKLGGAGLALIGIGGALREEALPPADAASIVPTLQALARFVLFMQQPNGDFRGKYEEPKGFDTDFESLYYPGEAVLGLTILYELDGDRAWLEAAARAVARLVESRRNAKRLPNDHWLMIAIDRLLPRYGDLATPPLPRGEVLGHAIALGRTMIDEQARVLARHGDPAIDGAFGSDGRTTPTATRLEGLLALEHAISADPTEVALQGELVAVISRGVAFLRRAQVREGLAEGGIPAGTSLDADAGEPDEPGDPPPDPKRGQEVRIDYVQHALSAMMRYAAQCPKSAGCD